MKTPVELRKSRFADVYDVMDAEGLEVCVSATYDSAAELVKIINAHEKLREALKKANTCMSIPDYVREVIQSALKE